jgi:hypothetical protein
MPTFNDQVQFNEVKLERFKFAIQQVFDEQALFGEPPRIDIQEHTRFMADQAIMTIRQNIWGLEVQRQECKWPADWWQAFKERWYPEWAKKRWPVRYEQYVITARELYPQVSLPPDRYNAVIAIDKHRYWAEFDDA